MPPFFGERFWVVNLLESGTPSEAPKFESQLVVEEMIPLVVPYGSEV